MSKEPRAGREEILECQVMWEPDSKKNTQMDRFRAVVGAAYGLALENYDDLYHWSVESYSDFWAEFWKFSGIVFSHTYDEVVDTSKGIADVPEWFKGSRLNYAENLLQHGENDGVALYVAREGREEIKKVSFEELRRQVALYAAAMRKMGVRRGDRVIGYLPNSGHAVEAMLAATSIGAIWSSTSPDFGVNGVLDRFSQIQPKLIFSVEAVVYNGKEHDHIDKLQQVVKGLADLKKVVVIPYVSSREKIDISKIPNSVFLEDFLATGQGAQAPQLEFEQLPFSHPLFIMFSSGTTGAPKCMVHSAGGTLIQHLKEHILHGNMTSSDIILYYTTVGWMMWNWMVSALATGAAVVLYDGSPLVPTPNVLWDLVDRIGITILGTGAKWLSVLEEKDVKPVETHSLQTLHTILSTGSPLKAQSYDYVYRCIKSSVLLGSISGGTDIMSCFVGQNPSIPVYRGEIQARNLGMAVEVWNEEGKAVWGESGELVCTKPLPCQPTHFWNDENGSKYWKAYFSKFPGVWVHGDYCRINPKTRGIIMLGRSDGTLNPNGVRFGSSEIYNIVHPQRQESGNGREADHRWENRGAPQSLLEPRDPGFVPGRPRAAGLLSRAGTSLSHTRLSCHFCAFKELLRGTSLVAQWLRIRLPMQGTRVRALVWEDPTCRGATKPVRHNC
ncbi:acetoacetyl-CoA synthetase isoform X3 [Balaenoptera acutorostrata]|uniref:Acetoacetyl-CoA synthetase n=1 Tax=Balaenoptera acutorostrata TaxID=9767 RepID=A0ABM3RWY6_BALAC|nr:acetoacetyl-CoA synthetase isoform X3 [Balaenoptera acutorostrata]